MCGIVGFLARVGATVDGIPLVNRMSAALVHRGPDDTGAWFDGRNGIALAHRRLSVLDLSPAGRQPMTSPCGRYVVVFNGEIYNHLAMRQELAAVAPGFGWRGHSDTETLLAAICRWGIEEALKRSVGMFALALWDQREKSLTLARDRLGEKPLYYGWQGRVLLFASELKALTAHPAFLREIDRDSLSLFLRYAYIPGPYSIYRGVRKLPPGTYVVISADATTERVVPYWSARSVAISGLREPFDGTADGAIDELERLLKDAVAAQMVADVPIGAFLSGGVDSSTVVALMQAQSLRPVKTFTIGFHEAQFDEAAHARDVARHLGTDHTELYVSPAEAFAAVPQLPEMYDEPFADPSQIPTLLMSRLARRHVTVCLSGDGGDELFGGYNRYIWAVRSWHSMGWAPDALREALARAITSLPPSSWNLVFKYVSHLLPSQWRFADPGVKLHKLARSFSAQGSNAIYQDVVSRWRTPTTVVRNATEPPTAIAEAGDVAIPDQESRMMYLDLVSYLPDDILVKLDRAAMSASLESRVPLLDHRVVEFAWKVPYSLKIRGGQGKWLLRQLLYRFVPKHLVERPKMGFGVPLEYWLRGPLRDWAETLLCEQKLHQEGYFDPLPIREKWREHLSGRRNWSEELWIVLMFEAWLERWASAVRQP